MGIYNFYNLKHLTMKLLALAASSPSLPPVPHQQLVSVTDTSQPTERTSITPRNSGRVTSPNTEPLTHTTKTAPSPSQTTGRVPNNAPNHGNAEVPDSAREEDGAPDMTDVRELHSQIKLQDFSQTAEHCDSSLC